jgi:hypothetical protein
MSIVTCETRFICSKMLGHMCMVHVCFRMGKASHSELKTNLLHGPGYRLVNAIKLSLQSDRNT